MEWNEKVDKIKKYLASKGLEINSSDIGGSIRMGIFPIIESIFRSTTSARMQRSLTELMSSLAIAKAPFSITNEFLHFKIFLVSLLARLKYNSKLHGYEIKDDIDLINDIYSLIMFKEVYEKTRDEIGKPNLFENIADLEQEESKLAKEEERLNKSYMEISETNKLKVMQLEEIQAQVNQKEALLKNKMEEVKKLQENALLFGQRKKALENEIMNKDKYNKSLIENMIDTPKSLLSSITKLEESLDGANKQIFLLSQKKINQLISLEKNKSVMKNVEQVCVTLNEINKFVALNDNYRCLMSILSMQVETERSDSNKEKDRIKSMESVYLDPSILAEKEAKIEQIKDEIAKYSEWGRVEIANAQETQKKAQENLLTVKDRINMESRKVEKKAELNKRYQRQQANYRELQSLIQRLLEQANLEKKKCTELKSLIEQKIISS
jgi:hypothetical protein